MISARRRASARSISSPIRWAAGSAWRPCAPRRSPATRTFPAISGDVILASPDIDMTVFASQMARVRPADVTVFATPNDRALSLSSLIASSRQRVGAIDASKPEDRAEIESARRQGGRHHRLFRRRPLHQPRGVRQLGRGDRRDRRADRRAARRGRQDASRSSTRANIRIRTPRRRRSSPLPVRRPRPPCRSPRSRRRR